MGILYRIIKPPSMIASPTLRLTPTPAIKINIWITKWLYIYITILESIYLSL